MVLNYTPPVKSNPGILSKTTDPIHLAFPLENREDAAVSGGSLPSIYIQNIALDVNKVTLNLLFKKVAASQQEAINSLKSSLQGVDIKAILSYGEKLSNNITNKKISLSVDFDKRDNASQEFYPGEKIISSDFSSQRLNKITDFDGAVHYEVPFSIVFTDQKLLEKGSPKHLTVTVFSFTRAKGEFLEGIKPYLSVGKLTSEIIYDNFMLQEKSKIFYTAAGKIYAGPVQMSSNGSVIKAGTSNSFGEGLIQVNIPNAKIKDNRILDDIKLLEDIPLREDPVTELPEFSNIYLSVDRLKNTRFIFGIDCKTVYYKNIKLNNFVKNDSLYEQLMQKMKIRSMKVYRIETFPTNDREPEKSELIISSKDSEPRSFAKNTLFDEQQRPIGSVQEVYLQTYLDNSSDVRYFSVVDYEASRLVGGAYYYRIEVEYEDKSEELFDIKRRSLDRTIKEMKDYVVQAELGMNHSSNRFDEDFIKTHINQKETLITKSLITYSENLSILTNVTLVQKRKILRNLFNMIHPSSGNVDGLLYYINSMEKLKSKHETALIKSDFLSGKTVTHQSSLNHIKAEKNVFTITKDYNKAEERYNSSCVANVGIDYLHRKGQSVKEEGIVKVPKEEWKKRVADEETKFPESKETPPETALITEPPPPMLAATPMPATADPVVPVTPTITITTTTTTKSAREPISPTTTATPSDVYTPPTESVVITASPAPPVAKVPPPAIPPVEPNLAAALTPPKAAPTPTEKEAAEAAKADGTFAAMLPDSAPVAPLVEPPPKKKPDPGKRASMGVPNETQVAPIASAPKVAQTSEIEEVTVTQTVIERSATPDAPATRTTVTNTHTNTPAAAGGSSGTASQIKASTGDAGAAAGSATANLSSYVPGLSAGNEGKEVASATEITHEVIAPPTIEERYVERDRRRRAAEQAEREAAEAAEMPVAQADTSSPRRRRVMQRGRTSVQAKHYHEFVIDENGNGIAREACNPAYPNICHVHKVVNFVVQPAESMSVDPINGAPPHAHVLKDTGQPTPTASIGGEEKVVAAIKNTEEGSRTTLSDSASHLTPQDITAGDTSVDLVDEPSREEYNNLSDTLDLIESKQDLPEKGVVPEDVPPSKVPAPVAPESGVTLEDKLGTVEDVFLKNEASPLSDEIVEEMAKSLDSDIGSTFNVDAPAEEAIAEETPETPVADVLGDKTSTTPSAVQEEDLEAKYTETIVPPKQVKNERNLNATHQEVLQETEMNDSSEQTEDNESRPAEQTADRPVDKTEQAAAELDTSQSEDQPPDTGRRRKKKKKKKGRGQGRGNDRTATVDSENPPPKQVKGTYSNPDLDGNFASKNPGKFVINHENYGEFNVKFNFIQRVEVLTGFGTSITDDKWQLLTEDLFDQIDGAVLTRMRPYSDSNLGIQNKFSCSVYNEYFIIGGSKPRSMSMPATDQVRQLVLSMKNDQVPPEYSTSILPMVTLDSLSATDSPPVRRRRCPPVPEVTDMTGPPTSQRPQVFGEMSYEMVPSTYVQVGTVDLSGGDTDGDTGSADINTTIGRGANMFTGPKGSRQ